MGTVEEALRLGYRMIDTAADYGTQPGIGKAIRRSEAHMETLKDANEHYSSLGTLPYVWWPADALLWEGMPRLRREYPDYLFDRVEGAGGGAEIH